MNHEVFNDFIEWLHQYDAENKISFQKFVHYENPALRFDGDDFNNAIYEAAVNHGFDVEYYAFSVYVIAQ